MEHVQPFLNSVAERLGNQVDEFEPEIAPYARYALANQGKQLRPALVALSAESSNGLNDDLVTIGVIIEMVHLATLVHDDIMDEAEVRRRRPTLAANWGNEISVLLGDCLFAHALRLAASFPTPDICRAVASATNTVCSGEILQTQHRLNFEFTREDYFRVLAMKTGELFALSCELGGALAGADEGARRALRGYGLALGTAYQIFDDCVDIFGSEHAVGKSLGTDLARGKLTLPLLLTLERSGPETQGRLRELIEPWTPAAFPRVLEILEQHEAQSESRRLVRQFLDRARRHLDDLPASRGRMALDAVTRYLNQEAEALGAAPS